MAISKRIWSAWPQVSIRMRRVPQDVDVRVLHQCFAQYGNIVYIEKFEDVRGELNGEGRVRFEPPPTVPFWEARFFALETSTHTKFANVRITLELESPPSRFAGLIRSRVDNLVYYPAKLALQAISLDFGISDARGNIMVKKTIYGRDFPADEASPKIRLEADFRRKFCHLSFPFPQHELSDEGKQIVTIQQYRAEVEIDQLRGLILAEPPKAEGAASDDQFVYMTIPFQHPPVYQIKGNDVATTFESGRTLWTSNDQWNRATHIISNTLETRNFTVGLLNSWGIDGAIDIGRWTTLRLKIPYDRKCLEDFTAALADVNITIRKSDVLGEVPNRQSPLLPENRPIEEDDTKEEGVVEEPPTPSHSTMQDLLRDDTEAIRFVDGPVDQRHEAVDIIPYLPFNVQYQLEVCLSRGMLNEFTLPSQFYQKLRELPPQRAQFMLEYLADRETCLENPMDLFDDPKSQLYYPNLALPHYCTVMRKAIITPTTIYYNTPAVESTNRVTRKWSSQVDRFLRVQFTDELFRGRIITRSTMTIDMRVFMRVFIVLMNGIRIGDRHYKFLAFGNSQIRENGAYFFCETPDLTCEQMRNWMGSFDHIRVVAKYAARLGQCFSTTREIRGIRSPTIKVIEDIEHNGYCFSDGVGRISPPLARIVAEDMGYEMTTGDEPPSAVQFRMGGCKGVLAVWPEAKGLEVHVRRSQEKFKAEFNGLEIIRYARHATATLNRQTITILGCLGVPDKNIIKLVDNQITQYAEAMQDQYAAIDILERHVDENQMSLMLKDVINFGFIDPNIREPVVLTFLHLWRAWSMKNLREKARVVVDSSAFVLGVVDETGTLRGHSKASEGQLFSRDVDMLPQIFIQVPKRGGEDTTYSPIEGTCIVGRNPSLHPGDIRVVQAVDCPRLRHLRNVVVFPRTGDRDVPSMLSGGDLDGDDFFVIWDQDLIPPQWNYAPMSHSETQPQTVSHPVQDIDLIKFFVKYLRNDCLPLIATSHLAYADYLEDGAKNPKCLELAALHSKAVDYAKTGDPVNLPRHLRARRYPHFMARDDKKSNIYRSTGVLGQIHDKVHVVTFDPLYENKFDRRILDRFPHDEKTVETARTLKLAYDDAMRRLMAQRDIETEFEIFTGFPLSKPRVGSAYKYSEDIGREAGLLKQTFREEVYKAAGGRDFETVAPLVAAIYQVTAQQVQSALKENRAAQALAGDPDALPASRLEPKSMPFLTFPWIFHWVLGRIATGMTKSRDVVVDNAVSIVQDETKASETQAPREVTVTVTVTVTATATEDTAPASAHHHVEEALIMLEEAKQPQDWLMMPARLPDGQVLQRGELLDLFEDDEKEPTVDGNSGGGGIGYPCMPRSARAASQAASETQEPRAFHEAMVHDDGVKTKMRGDEKQQRAVVIDDGDPFASIFSLAKTSHFARAAPRSSNKEVQESDRNQDGPLIRTATSTFAALSVGGSSDGPITPPPSAVVHLDDRTPQKQKQGRDRKEGEGESTGEGDDGKEGGDAMLQRFGQMFNVDM